MLTPVVIIQQTSLLEKIRARQLSTYSTSKLLESNLTASIDLTNLPNTTSVFVIKTFLSSSMLIFFVKPKSLQS